jgi:hypothetical protein
VNRFPALRRHLIPAFQRPFELVLYCSRWKRLFDGLQPQHQPLETLQQCVMQIASHTGTLIDTFLYAHVEFASDLAEPVPGQPPQQRQKSGRAQRLKPTGLLQRRQLLGLLRLL